MAVQKHVHEDSSQLVVEKAKDFWARYNRPVMDLAGEG